MCIQNHLNWIDAATCADVLGRRAWQRQTTEKYEHSRRINTVPAKSTTLCRHLATMHAILGSTLHELHAPETAEKDPGRHMMQDEELLAPAGCSGSAVATLQG